MEGAAVAENVWPDPSQSGLHEGKTGAIVFPLEERLDREQTAEPEDQLANQYLSLPKINEGCQGQPRTKRLPSLTQGWKSS